MKTQKVTIADVAKKANVSKATVSYVLNDVDKVSAGTKERVLQTIKELGYVPNSSARNLALQASDLKEEQHPFYQDFMQSFVKNKIGSLPEQTKNKLQSIIREKGYLPSDRLDQLMNVSHSTLAIFLEMEKDYRHTLTESNPFYQEFISGIKYTAQENNLSIKIYNSLEEQSYSEVVGQHYVGFIILGQIPEKLERILLNMDEPVVVVDEYGIHPNFVTVNSEDQKGTFNSIEYLILKGHKRIAFAGCENDYGNFIDKRIEGYKEALEAYGIAYREEDVFISKIKYSYDEGINLANIIADSGRKYDAVFCPADIMAIGVMKGFLKRGYRIPEDLSIMGFDNIYFSRYCNPELTTVDQNIFLKAETAVTIVIRKAKGEKVRNDYMLPVSIVERESVMNRNE